ncbi:MAG: cupredoxin domain-containing protein [Patescibacteria group bacterium]
MDNKPMDNKPVGGAKKIWILLGVLVVIVIIIIVAAMQGKKPANQGTSQEPQTSGNEVETTGAEKTPAGEEGTTPVQNLEDNKVYSLDDAKAQIPGASLVTAGEQKVVTSEGKAAQNDAIPNSPAAPKPVLVAKDQLPAAAVKLEVGNGKITPASFTVTAGQVVNLAVSSADNQVHVFIFTNSAVGAIAMGVGPGETKAITFNAPAAGSYDFRCDVPGHKEKGEVGKMIVK